MTARTPARSSIRTFSRTFSRTFALASAWTATHPGTARGGGAGPGPGAPLLLAGALASVLGLGAATAWAMVPGQVTARATVSLIDDDGSAALFDGSVLMAPGRPQTSCIAVTAVGAAAGDTVALAATSLVGAGLAGHLAVTVEMGQGGRFGDCSGFTGGIVWTGTLGGLAEAAGSVGVVLDWRPEQQASRSFRISVVADSTARQGDSASADLQWRLVSAGAPTTPSGPGAPVPTPPAAVPTGAGPAPSATTAPSGSPTGGVLPGPSGTTGPTDSGGPPPVARSGGPGGQPGDDSGHGGSGPGGGAAPGRPGPDLVLGSQVQAMRTAILRTGQTIVEVARRPQLPLALLALVALFLAVQDWIDRRDPKLVLASMSQREVEVAFPDVFGGGG